MGKSTDTAGTPAEAPQGAHDAGPSGAHGPGPGRTGRTGRTVGTPRRTRVSTVPLTFAVAVLLVASLLLLPAAHAQSTETVVRESSADEGDWPDGNLDIESACMADVVVSDGGEAKLGGIRVCLRLRDLDTALMTRYMYAVEFTMDGQRYRAQANYSADPVEHKGVLVSGWFTSLERKSLSGWTVLADGSAVPLGVSETSNILRWTVTTSALPSLSVGDRLTSPQAFTYVNADEVDGLSATAESLLSDVLTDAVTNGQTLVGWSIADVAPGPTGAEYQLMDPSDRTYGDTFVVGQSVPSGDGDGDGTGDGDGDGTGVGNGTGDGTGSSSSGDGLFPYEPGTEGFFTYVILPVGLIAALIAGIAAYAAVARRRGPPPPRRDWDRGGHGGRGRGYDRDDRVRYAPPPEEPYDGPDDRGRSRGPPPGDRGDEGGSRQQGGDRGGGHAPDRGGAPDRRQATEETQRDRPIWEEARWRPDDGDDR